MDPSSAKVRWWNFRGDMEENKPVPTMWEEELLVMYLLIDFLILFLKLSEFLWVYDDQDSWEFMQKDAAVD